MRLMQQFENNLKKTMSVLDRFKSSYSDEKEDWSPSGSGNERRSSHKPFADSSSGRVRQKLYMEELEDLGSNRYDYVGTGPSRESKNGLRLKGKQANGRDFRHSHERDSASSRELSTKAKTGIDEELLKKLHFQKYRHLPQEQAGLKLARPKKTEPKSKKFDRFMETDNVKVSSIVKEQRKFNLTDTKIAKPSEQTVLLKLELSHLQKQLDEERARTQGLEKEFKKLQATVFRLNSFELQGEQETKNEMGRKAHPPLHQRFLEKRTQSTAGIHEPVQPAKRVQNAFTQTEANTAFENQFALETAFLQLKEMYDSVLRTNKQLLDEQRDLVARMQHLKLDSKEVERSVQTSSSAFAELSPAPKKTGAPSKEPKKAKDSVKSASSNLNEQAKSAKQKQQTLLKAKRGPNKKESTAEGAVDRPKRPADHKSTRAASKSRSSVPKERTAGKQPPNKYVFELN